MPGLDNSENGIRIDLDNTDNIASVIEAFRRPCIVHEAPSVSLHHSLRHHAHCMRAKEKLSAGEAKIET